MSSRVRLSLSSGQMARFTALSTSVTKHPNIDINTRVAHIAYRWLASCTYVMLSQSPSALRLLKQYFTATIDSKRGPQTSRPCQLPSQLMQPLSRAVNGTLCTTSRVHPSLHPFPLSQMTLQIETSLQHQPLSPGELWRELALDSLYPQ